MSNIHIAVADDHQMVITGLKDMLADAQHITIDDTYLTGEALLDGMQQRQPDVLLLDLRLPDRAGEELATLLLKNYPALRILILTTFDNMLYVHTLLNAGVHGYLLKNTDKATLLQAIETLYNGETYVEKEMLARLEQYRKNQRKNSRTSFALTPRELDILKLIAAGYSNQQIAEQLFLSLRTIENYRLNLSIKLEVKNTAGLVRRAIELGLVLY